jgi:hypothetical protein
MCFFESSCALFPRYWTCYEKDSTNDILSCYDYGFPFFKHRWFKEKQIMRRKILEEGFNTRIVVLGPDMEETLPWAPLKDIWISILTEHEQNVHR